jgi:TolB-like protein
MKTARLLFFFVPLAAYSGPIPSEGKPTVAVFDFKADWSVDRHVQVTDSGKAFASWLAHDLSVLPPIKVVDTGADDKLADHRKLLLGDTISPADAKQVGQSLGATALVTGQIFGSDTEIIVAAKVVSAESGETLGTAVKGGPTTPFADLVSQLSEQVGKIILLQQGVKQAPWPPATIVGSRNPVSTIIPNVPRLDLTGIVSIDGRAIPNGPEALAQEQPIRPGTHAVVIYYYEGHPTLTRRLVFDVQPGASYAVVYDRDAPNGSKLCIRDQKTHQTIEPLDESALASANGGNKGPDRIPGQWDEGPFLNPGNINNTNSLSGSPFGGGPPRSLDTGHK